MTFSFQTSKELKPTLCMGMVLLPRGPSVLSGQDREHGGCLATVPAQALGICPPHAFPRPQEAEPTALLLVWFRPVASLFIVLKRLNWSRGKKKRIDFFFFLPLSNESLGTFSLLTSESYPIAFAVRPDLQRTPWGKAKILVKPLKRKSTL